MGWDAAAIIIATFLGPVVAVQAQKYLEMMREEKNNQLAVFKSLMATRATPVSPQHVQALNSIDLEFKGEKFKKIREAWRTYLDHLNNAPRLDQSQGFSRYETDIAHWAEKGSDLLSTLLVEMGKPLGYSFDTVDIKRGIYKPQAHDQSEFEQQALRQKLFSVLSGNEELKMNVTHFPTDPALAKVHLDLLNNLHAVSQGGVLAVELKPPESAERPSDTDKHT